MCTQDGLAIHSVKQITPAFRRGRMPNASSWIPDVQWVQGVADAANADPAFHHVARWLDATILIEVEGDRFAVDVSRGRVIAVEAGEPITGWDFAIKGSKGEWAGVSADGQGGTGESLNRFTITNNRVLAATHWTAVAWLIRRLVTAAKESA
jgi:hypothetical protein